MRVVVFGAGAIGSLFGVRLARARHEVLLVAREEDVAAMRVHGISIEGTEETTALLPVVDALTDGMRADAILLTVKGPDVREAMREIGRRIRPVPPTLLLQNGLGIEREAAGGLEDVGAAAPVGILLRGVNTLPATRLGPGRIRAAGQGEVLLGTGASPEVGATTELLRALLTSGGIPVRVVPDIEREVWRKAILNAGINPVTADHGIPNGQIARDPWRGQVEQLVHEALQVARATGHPFTDDEIEADLWRVVRATAANRSSMLQDIDRGHRTEIDAISGEILRVGAEHGLELPQTQRIVARIRAKEPPAVPVSAAP